MTIELDHLFILTEPGAAEADLLLATGLVEGSSNRHRGQGTANRRFFFENTTLELLYVRDVAEAIGGPARGLRLHERQSLPDASPFGLITRTIEGDRRIPFDGWKYHPDYLPADQAFHVGDNAEILEEPLCICMPDGLSPGKATWRPENARWSLTGMHLDIPVPAPSSPLRTILACQGASARFDEPHCLHLTFDHGTRGVSRDFRPALPLIIDG